MSNMHANAQFVDVTFINHKIHHLFQLLRDKMQYKEKIATKVLVGSVYHINIWDLTTSSVERKIGEHKDCVTTVLRLSDGMIASGSRDETLIVWDPETSSRIETYHGHENVICNVVELADGRLATTSVDKKVIVWNRKTKKQESVLLGHNSAILCLQKLQNGKLASGDDCGNTLIWDLSKITTNEVYAAREDRLTRKGATMALIQLSDGTLVIANQSIGLFDYTTKILEREIKTQSIVFCFLDLLDGRVLTGHNNGMIHVWYERFSRSEVIFEEKNYTAPVTTMAHLGGDLIVTATGGYIIIYNIKRKEVIKNIFKENKVAHYLSVAVLE
jgi:WD40 repeat protein